MSFKLILEPLKKVNNKLFNHIRLRPILHLGLIIFISIVIGPVSSRPQKYSNTHHQQQYHLNNKEVDSKLKVVENQTISSYVPMTEENDFKSEEGEDVITEQMIKNMTEETENGLEQELGLDTVRKLDDKEQKEVPMEMSVEEMFTNTNGDRGPLFDILRDYGGSEGFRTVLVRAQGLDNATQDDVLVEELNMTLSTLNATLNSGNVSNISVNDPEYREMQKNSRESQDSASSERNKEFRLNAIKTQILSYLGLLGKEPVINTSVSNPQQMEIMRTMYERMQQSPQWPLSDTYTEKVQSFYPSCEIPRNTDQDLWSDENSMNLLFDLSYPIGLEGATVNIMAAKLRLHKLSHGDHTATGETCATLALSDLAQTSTEDFQQGNGQTKSQYMSTLPVTPTYKDEKQVRVSVYWYTRSLKKNRVKRKLLDSRMVSIYGEEWLEFNVKSAARVWRESGKNFGLSIQVEDEDNQVLPAVKYFSFMDCSNEASTARPIPGFLVNAARDYILENTRNETNNRRSNTIYLDSLMFPMIDLFTIEMPEHEMVDAALLYQTRYSLTQHMSNTNSFSPHSPIVKMNSYDPNIDQIDPPQGEKLINYVVNVEEDEHRENTRLKRPNNQNRQEQQIHEINDYQYSKENLNLSSTVKTITPKIRHPRHSLKVPHKHRLLSLSFRIDQKQARNKENEELLNERYLCCNYNDYQVKNQTFIPKMLFSFNPYLNASVSQKKLTDINVMR